MTFHKGYFTVPCEWLSKDIERGNEKAVVVSIFGQSTVDSSGYKTTPLELMLGKNVLRRNMIDPISLPHKDLTGIEGYYDPYRRIVFLHLTGALDSSTLLKSINKLNDQLQEKGFLVVWSELRLQYARSLLLLFCMSHILLLWHPSHIFDITYIHLFRTLDSIRSKFQQNFVDILKNITGVSKDWQSVGRICSPRVLFIFSSRLIPYHVMKETGNNKSNAGNRCDKNLSTPLRKLELDLEYQIYRLLRKSRVITNISANSLFALPNNQPFVYLLEDFQDLAGDASTMIKKALNEICAISTDINKALFSSVLVESKGLLSNNSGPKECAFISPLSDPQDSESLSHTLLSTMSTERKRNLEHSFNLFLKQHIDEALTRGFDDSVGRHAAPNLFEVPKVSVWFEAFHKLYEYFVEAPEEDAEGNENQVINSLRNNLETDIRFSDARCSKVLPLALSAYNEGLPSHYTRAHHQSKLDVALGILASQARGPMYDKYVKQLEETCEQTWQDGRIGCEVLSLTGKTCHHPLHTVTKEPDSSLPVMSHSSNIAYVSFCNCGRHQSPMEDPYSVKAANFDYYEKMKESFCSVLESFPFPSFKSSIDDARAAEVNIKSSQEWSDELEAGRISKDNPTMDTDTPQTPLELSIESAGLSQGLNANHPGIAEDGGQEDEIIVTVKEDAGRSEEHSAEDMKGLGIDRQASTTEYLPTMLTSSSPAGLLPQFSSWSLVCLGPSSLYSHNAGICEQPGFLPGTNFLLPWDVTIKIRDKDKWPAIADSMGKKGFLLKNKKNRMGGDLSEFSVKIFLGTEYQCPRGHRFMMAAPDRHLKASSLGHVKDTAVKISNSDMPLYFPCPCSRRNSFVNGQLMRLHVVTPKAPVHVTLNPQVQPSPDSFPKFIPQPPSSPVIKLSASAYWILRLPFVYVGDTGPHYPPNPYQVNVSSYGKLLKGCYGISEITLDR